MKKQTRYIFLVALLAIGAIVCYQGYWLRDIYYTLQADLQRDIQEAMRASDFEEMVRRVEALRNEHLGGEMNVSVGVNESRDKAVVENEYSSTLHREEAEVDEALQEEQTEPSHNQREVNKLEFDDFADALRSEADVMGVGLQMQRGVHTGLDQLKPTDAACYDSLLAIRLDSLGVTNQRYTLHLRKHVDDEGREGGAETLYRYGKQNLADVDTFRLVLNAEGTEEYVLCIEKSIFALPQKMYAPIFLSLFTLLILIVAFWYIINMLKRMYALDEIKSDFINNITHELKTPIAVAYAANDALLNHGSLEDKGRVRRYLHICLEQLDQLTGLVEQILSVSMEQRKNMQLTFEDISVEPIVSQLVSNHRVKAPDVQFHVDIELGLQVNADKMHFTNIVNNLIDNAIKYSKDEACVTITGKQEANGNQVISVVDNGIGIARENQRFIFDKFYRVPHGNLHDVKGHGLGLYYAQSLMKRFGGQVTLHSELGKGSTFTLVFPPQKPLKLPS